MNRVFFGAGDRGRTGTVSLPLDFESSTSANSITPAGIRNGCIIHDSERKIKRNFRIGDRSRALICILSYFRTPRREQHFFVEINGGV